MASVARDTGTQLVHYLRKTLSPVTTATTVTLEIGSIPANAIVLAGLSGIYSTATWDGTTNVVSIGYAVDSVSSANTAAYASALAIPLTTGMFVVLDELATATGRPVAVDRSITATWSGTATTGSLEVVICYVPNR